MDATITQAPYKYLSDNLATILLPLANYKTLTGTLLKIKVSAAPAAIPISAVQHTF